MSGTRHYSEWRDWLHDAYDTDVRHEATEIKQNCNNILLEQHVLHCGHDWLAVLRFK
jgi:hypothetical protein